MQVVAAIITHPEVGVVAIGIGTTDLGALCAAVDKMCLGVDTDQYQEGTEELEAVVMAADADHEIEYEFANL